MKQKDFDTLLHRIEDGLSKNSDPKQKMFWQGFIVSLCDYNVIDYRIFRNLLDTISCWKKGDTTSRMVPITDLPES